MREIVQHDSTEAEPSLVAEWQYTPGFLALAEADELLETMLEAPDWAHDTVRMFGRVHETPRLVAWYGDPGTDYRYSGTTHRPLPWLPCLGALRRKLERSTGFVFDSVLANYYRDGRDSMGWHSDDERELGPHPVIASVSVGAKRRFLLRPRAARDLPVREFELEHGSLFLMQGTTQQRWKHSLPKTVRCDAPRVNLTFRRVLNVRSTA